MDEPAAVIIVDDEPDLRAMVAEYLGRHGFAPRTAAGGSELDRLLAEAPCDLVVLDVNMPGEDGFSIARRLRAAGSMPILMLAAASDIVDRVVGLELGADDYLTKPFDLRELRARIRSVLRRAAAEPAATPGATPAAAADRYVRFGRMRLDRQVHALLDEQGRPVPLTTMEFDLLIAFAANPNRVLSRERLLDLAHNRGFEPFDRSIDIRVTRLRRKVEDNPAKPAVIKTVHGAGYIFVPAA